MAGTLRVLLVDGDPAFADRTAAALADDHGLAVETEAGAAALDRVRTGEFDCAVVGDPAGIDGPELARRVREAAPGVAVVALVDRPEATRDGDRGADPVAEALDAGVDDCLPGPTDGREGALAARIRRAVRARSGGPPPDGDATPADPRGDATPADPRDDATAATPRDDPDGAVGNDDSDGDVRAGAAPDEGERARRLDRRAPVPVVVYAESGIVFLNDPALAFFGVEGFGPLVGRDPADVLDAGEDLAAALAGVLDDREGVGPVEHRFVAADGRERVCRLSAAPTSHDGEPAGRILVEDLTDRRRAADGLDRERRRLDAALRAAGDVAYVTDADGRIVGHDDRLAAVAGRNDDLSGVPVTEVVGRGGDEADPGGDASGDGGASDDGPPAPGVFEGRIRTADGEDRRVAVREVPVPGDGDGPTGRVGIGWIAEDGAGDAGTAPSPVEGFDRTRGRRLDRLRTVLRNASVGLFALGPDGTVELAAGEPLALAGIDPATAVGRSLPDAVEDPALRAACRTALDGEAAEVTVEAGDRAVEVRLVPGDGDRPAVGTVVEVTERRARERELDRYRTLVEATGDAMYALDREGRVTMVNDAGAALAGVDREELLGAHVGEYVPDEDVRRGTDALRELLDGDAGDVARFEIRGADGTVYEDIVAVLTGDDGAFRGSVGVLRDVTERKRRERELREKNERLEEFASVVAHDLRGPLSVAYTDLEAAVETGDAERIRDALASLDRMDELLTDLLTLARQGESVDDTEPVDVAESARDAWDDTDTDPAGATLHVEAPGVVEADPIRLRELFENLFRNSVEHGSTGPQSGTGDGAPAEGSDDEAGGVAVRVGPLPDRPGFFVADDGPGIPAGEREAVFDRGYTLDGDGTGFGLAIVEGIARAHGWSVSVAESDAGGARFEVATGDRTGDE